MSSFQKIATRGWKFHNRSIVEIGSLVLLILSFSFFNTECKTNKPKSWVVDDEKILTQEQRTKFDSLFTAHEKRTSNEIVLVTTPGYGVDSNIIEYSKHFGNQIRIGKKKLNNGIVIVFSKNQHETRIATGYGSERVLGDQVAQNIIDSLMLPRFRDAKYFKGLWEGSIAVIRILEKPENKIH